MKMRSELTPHDLERERSEPIRDAREYYCAVDTGGTFTDCVVRDSEGNLSFAKSPSTPWDFSEGFFAALSAAAEQLGLTLAELMARTRMLLHGTTVGTNAIVEMKGARVGLITTRGHGDALLIMRSVGRSAGLPIERLLHVSRHQKPQPLVPRHLIREVSERVDWQGKVIVPLNRDEARRAIEELLEQQVEAIAIAFLWGFINPIHEQEVRRMVQEMAPDLFVTCAHELIAKPGEYERTAATVINCFIGPKTAHYVQRVERRARELGYTAPLLVMQAAGGVTPAEEILRAPLFTIGSGPVGGLMGARFLAETLGHSHVIATDMGGTSFDVGLIVEGRPLSASETTLHQYTFFMPRLDIISIGAGGGSIIWVDELSGTMKVGPESAGADPGPACYGRGNMRPTVTDADLLLGYYNPDFFLGGQLKLDREAAYRAMCTVAEPLGLEVLEAADGATRIVETHMADLIRQMTIQRGYDPRDFVVYAYGGAAGAHAAAYARELGCRTVVVPGGALASTWSAFGILSTDIQHVYEKAELLIAPFEAARVTEIFFELEERVRRQLREEGVPEDRVLLQRFVEMKFRLQIHRVEVPVPGGILTDQDMRDLERTFVHKYESLYGRGSAYTAAGMEIGLLRVIGLGRVAPRGMRKKTCERAQELRPIGQRDVYWRELGSHHQTPIFNGETMPRGGVIEGPAILELPVTTIVVRPDSVLTTDEYGNFILTLA
ncbi:MAG: hydantoinase/oxoprolinase family protein [Blastocatellia bacterium]|nr:hydantoinase/oxoprolinase family protein [Blastocatellia bacterium]MCS7156099.1 hydantoinase/oxoprolinase family protein [Blastocatellia bacterium]MDW8169264.1 hydantoinase/oxoprolinase family protein [Acidobacteriota bacterium]MDW8256123.1 hydantoinase/oxoprolinase family protein [Acidobacteriota bacterium]